MILRAVVGCSTLDHQTCDELCKQDNYCAAATSTSLQPMDLSVRISNATAWTFAKEREPKADTAIHNPAQSRHAAHRSVNASRLYPTRINLDAISIIAMISFKC
ncbi:hypothetical protein QR680_001159 [Steinernema hermaphroditum]|uniref:Uncharacterized protein n=1 Tax=Steinernema hermaphroditum TaxID=289476 RepID=A0AA39GX94_9BILA|nr:hypothetical protein QR680_001159 [Steinernema hermaphroditum]